MNNPISREVPAAVGLAERADRPISRDAFLQRCRRRLRQEGESLHITRGERWYSDLGYLYITDDYTNSVIACHCTYESLQRDLQVLKPGETLPVD